LGHDRDKSDLVILILGIEKLARILNPQPLTECRSVSHTSAGSLICGGLCRDHSSCRLLALSYLVFIGYKRKHLLLTPPLCCFLLASRRFPLKL